MLSWLVVEPFWAKLLGCSFNAVSTISVHNYFAYRWNHTLCWRCFLIAITVLGCSVQSSSNFSENSLPQTLLAHVSMMGEGHWRPSDWWTAQQRAFSVAGHVTWNWLPRQVRCLPRVHPLLFDGLLETPFFRLAWVWSASEQRSWRGAI